MSSKRWGSVTVLLTVFLILSMVVSVSGAGTGTADFEEGDLRDFDSTVDTASKLSVTVGAAYEGTYGMYCDTKGTTTVGYGVLLAVGGVQTSGTASAWFSAETVGYQGTGAIVQVVLVSSARVVVGLTGNAVSGWQVTAYIYDDGGIGRQSPYYAVAAGWHRVMVSWVPATGVGANNGQFWFYIDGVLRYTLVDVDNDTRTWDRGWFGLRTIPPYSTGYLYMDDLSVSGSSTSPTATPTPSETATATETYTPTASFTPTGSNTRTLTATATITRTATYTPFPSWTPVATWVPTTGPSATAVPSRTPVDTVTPGPSATIPDTATHIPHTPGGVPHTATVTPSRTSTATATGTSTSTATVTPMIPLVGWFPYYSPGDYVAGRYDRAGGDVVYCEWGPALCSGAYWRSLGWEFNVPDITYPAGTVAGYVYYMDIGMSVGWEPWQQYYQAGSWTNCTVNYIGIVNGMYRYGCWHSAAGGGSYTLGGARFMWQYPSAAQNEIMAPSPPFVLWWPEGPEPTPTPTATVTPTPVVCDWSSWYFYPTDWRELVGGVLEPVLVMYPGEVSGVQMMFEGDVTIIWPGGSRQCMGGIWCNLEDDYHVMAVQGEWYCYGSDEECTLLEAEYLPTLCEPVEALPEVQSWYEGWGLQVRMYEPLCLPVLIPPVTGGDIELALCNMGAMGSGPDCSNFVSGIQYRVCLDYLEVTGLQVGDWNLGTWWLTVTGLIVLVVVGWYGRK